MVCLAVLQGEDHAAVAMAGCEKWTVLELNRRGTGQHVPAVTPDPAQAVTVVQALLVL